MSNLSSRRSGAQHPQVGDRVRLIDPDLHVGEVVEVEPRGRRQHVLVRFPAREVLVPAAALVPLDAACDADRAAQHTADLAASMARLDAAERAERHRRAAEQTPPASSIPADLVEEGAGSTLAQPSRRDAGGGVDAVTDEQDARRGRGSGNPAGAGDAAGEPR